MKEYEFLTDVLIVKGDRDNPETVMYHGRKFGVNRKRSTDKTYFFENSEETMKVAKEELKLSTNNISR